MVQLITDEMRRSSTPVTYEDSVEIVGTVRSGAKLRVLGDVTVYGNVEDAEIEAEGSVTVDGGFLGSGGVIWCGGDFVARFVQGQRVVAESDVKITSAVLSSIVFSSGSVIIGEGKGTLVGGEIHAYRSVEAGTIGSQRPVMTRIEVGMDPLVAVAIEELEEEAMELTRKRLSFIKDLGTLTGDERSLSPADKVTDMQAAAEALHGDILGIGERILALRQGARCNSGAVVIAGCSTHPPLEISICRAKLINESATGPMIFRLFDDRVVLDPSIEG
jgi:uncharacterized protein (DUF342 family)